MSITDTLSERIIDYTKELRLPGIRKNFKEQSIYAGHNYIPYEKFLNDLLEKEYDLRLVNRKKRKIREDRFVLFTTIPSLITQLQECQSERTLRAFENKFEKYDLVICDELEYISFDKKGSELLFTHLSLRAGRKSIIITTNLSFNRWNEIFNDEVLTTALIDRLTYKAYIINMNGSSYRIKETINWRNSKEKKAKALSSSGGG